MKPIGKVLILICSLFFISFLAQADEVYDLSEKWGVGFGVGVDNVLGSDLYTKGTNELSGSFAGGLWARYHLSERFGLELSYTKLALDYDSALGALVNLNPSVDVYDLSLAYRMYPKSRWHGLVQLGLGYARLTDLGGASQGDDDFSVKLRLGPEFMATNELMLSLYLDLHQINTGGGSKSELMTLSPLLALTYYFGQSEPTPQLVDTDGDGIGDELDKCPGTGSGVAVDNQGCPLAVDSDKDGVVDSEDQCPGTPSGKPVTAYGCTQTQKLEFVLNVQFALGKSSVDDRYAADLKKFAQFFKKYPQAKAEIEGHTDSTGSEQVNFRISQARANSVRNYLIKKAGIKASRLTAKGYGPTQPVADNSTEAGRQKNRRVVAHVQATVEKK